MAFTMATWNTLANAYIRPDYYPRTPAEFLDPAWRLPALREHARSLEADVLCLQEVEEPLFQSLQQSLPGYQGTHALKGASRPDGCATFFRTSLFGLLEHTRLEYRDNSGHIAQWLLVEHEDKRLAIANTHVRWDPPNTPRDKQWGYGQILEAMDLFHSGGSDAQIVCGDFNATEKSDLVGALLDAGFHHVHAGFPGMATANSNSQPKRIDYLFSRGPLKARAFAPDVIDGFTPLPSRVQPSDHLPLVARFEWL
jgi:mRNA deadenylase 3'-5' endonuclease subunit Ccr4